MSFQEILRPCGRAPVPPCSQAPPAPDWRQTLYRTRSGIMRLLGASLCRRAPVSAGTTPPGPPSDQTLEMNLAKSRHAPPGAIATQIASQPGQTPTLLLLLPLPASCAMARRPPPPPSSSGSCPPTRRETAAGRRVPYGPHAIRSPARRAPPRHDGAGRRNQTRNTRQGGGAAVAAAAVALVAAGGGGWRRWEHLPLGVMSLRSH